VSGAFEVQFRQRREEEVSITLTPLIDVVFLLLIFFMVSTTFDKTSELKIDLPEASAEPVETPPRVLEVVVNARGTYFINGQEVKGNTVDALLRVLVKTVGDERDMPVILRADATTPHQAVVRAMDAVSQLGMNRLSIATTSVPTE
jgi:biopolymer transport protein ExbD